ncbi:MAG: tyrosine-type recombinase/integrase [Janthinobacterium lividum]
MTRYVYRAQTHVSREPGEDITWEELLQKFLAAKAKRSVKYQYDLKNSLTRAHLALIEIGITRPCMMTTKAAKTYRQSYQLEFGISDLTVNHLSQKLMTEFSWAFEEEIFATDKLAALKKIEVTDKKKRVPVKMEEINAIIGQIYDDWLEENAPASRFRSQEARDFFGIRDVCMTLWMPETGSRIGETTRVQRADLNLDDRSALLRDTKNGDDRLVYFTLDFRDGILADWLAIRDGLDTVCDNLFVSELGMPLDPYRWGRQWDKYRQRAGIERRIRRHDLRHYSSNAHDRVDKDSSKKLIGHHTDAAHEIYSCREEARLRADHDQANPVGPILVRLREEREAKAAAAEAAKQPKPVRPRVYTKPQ